MNTLDENRGDWTSASNAASDHLCPGRHQAQRGMPELPKTPESTTGERIHAIWCGPGCLNATEEEKDAAESLFEQERELAEQYFGKEAAFETVRCCEQRLWHEFPALFQPHHDLKTSGRFDVVRIHPGTDRALLLDGKTGWRQVEISERNLQLRRLAALVSLNMGALDEIAVAVLKPHSKPSQLCVYSYDDLAKSVAEMERDVSASHNPNAKRIPGEEQCRYCRAREVCPARQAWLGEIMPKALPLPMMPAHIWTPKQRSLFLEREASIRKWLEDRKEEIKELLEKDPDAVPGYRLAPGDVRETITDLQEVYRRFAVEGGTTSQFLKAVKGVKKNLTEQVREVTGLKGNALKSKVGEMIEGCTEWKRSAPTIEKTSAIDVEAKAA